LEVSEYKSFIPDLPFLDSIIQVSLHWGRIDHARITPGTLIPMHPHQNDEILTYLRNGKVK